MIKPPILGGLDESIGSDENMIIVYSKLRGHLTPQV